MCYSICGNVTSQWLSWYCVQQEICDYKKYSMSNVAQKLTQYCKSRSLGDVMLFSVSMHRYAVCTGNSHWIYCLSSLMCCQEWREHLEEVPGWSCSHFLWVKLQLLDSPQKIPVYQAPGSQPIAPMFHWRKGLSPESESWQSCVVFLQPGSPNAGCYWLWRRWSAELVKMQRKEKKQWQWIEAPGVPPHEHPCYPEGWSAGSGNIQQGASGEVLWNGVYISCRWSHFFGDGCLRLPEGQSLGKI